MSGQASALVDSAGVRDTAALKPALLGLAGASIEWYDFLLYGTAAALVFPTTFFPPTLAPFVGLIASFSTFAVGFLVRPVGAALLGHIGDRVGRKTAFAAALIIMGSATTLIGLMPSYRTAGVLAPLGLVLLRLTQGLAVGGQWGGATLLATESAPKSKRGLYGSIAQAGVPVGVVLANLAFLTASEATSPVAFASYGWRIPFLLSMVLIGLGLYIHLRAEDTTTFRLSQRDTPTLLDRHAAISTSAAATRASDSARGRLSPPYEALRLHPRAIFLAAGSFAYGILAFYILTTYVVAYGTTSAGLRLPRSAMLAAVLIGQIASTPFMFVGGKLSDRYGRRRVLMTGAVLMGVWAFVLFPVMDTRSLPWITVAIGVGLCCTGLSYGPLAAMFAELFDTRVRYSAISIAYQISAIIGGGVGPIVATALYAKYHSNLGVSVFMASACVVALICVGVLKETHGSDLDTRGEPTVA